MTTTKFTITADIPGFGKVQHIIREASEDAAIQKMARAYPDQELSIVRLLRAPVTRLTASSPD